MAKAAAEEGEVAVYVAVCGMEPKEAVAAEEVGAAAADDDDEHEDEDEDEEDEAGGT